MKKHVHIISLLLFMASVSINAQKQTLHLGLGWNLGNQMDAYVNGVANETSWGNGKATQQTFDSLKAMGFSTVRIPVTWLGHIGSAPDYKIEESWLNRVAQLVDYAETAGLNVVINIHHDGGSSQRRNCQPKD